VSDLRSWLLTSNEKGTSENINVLILNTFYSMSYIWSQPTWISGKKKKMTIQWLYVPFGFVLFQESEDFFFFIFPFCPILKLHVYPAVTAILDFWSTHKTHILLRTIQIIFQQYYVSLNIRNGWWGTVDYAWLTVNCDSWGINKTEARYVFHIFSSSLGICSFILTSIFT
jgi:hypothetical protein